MNSGNFRCSWTQLVLTAWTASLWLGLNSTSASLARICHLPRSVSTTSLNGTSRCVCQGARPSLLVAEQETVLLACLPNRNVAIGPRGCIFNSPHGKQMASFKTPGIRSPPAGYHLSLEVPKEAKACLAGFHFGCFLTIDQTSIADDSGQWSCEMALWDGYSGAGMKSTKLSNFPTLTVTARCDPRNASTCPSTKMCHEEARFCYDPCEGPDGEGYKECSKIAGSSCVTAPHMETHGYYCRCGAGLVAVRSGNGDHVLKRCSPKCRTISDCHSMQECRAPSVRTCFKGWDNCMNTCISPCEDSSCPDGQCMMGDGSCTSGARCTMDAESSNLYSCSCIEGFSMVPEYTSSNSKMCLKQCKTYQDCLHPSRETCFKERCHNICDVQKCGLGTDCTPNGNDTRSCKCQPELYRVNETYCNVPISPNPWHPIIMLDKSALCVWPQKASAEVRWLNCFMPREAILGHVSHDIRVYVRSTFPRPKVTIRRPREAGDSLVNAAEDMERDPGKYIDAYPADYSVKFSFTPEYGDHKDFLNISVQHPAFPDNELRVFVELNVYGCSNDSDCRSNQICRATRSDDRTLKKCVNPCSHELSPEDACPANSTCALSEKSHMRRTCLCPRGFVLDAAARICRRRCGSDGECTDGESCVSRSLGPMSPIQTSTCQSVCTLPSCPGLSCKPSVHHQAQSMHCTCGTEVFLFPQQCLYTWQHDSLFQDCSSGPCYKILALTSNPKYVVTKAGTLDLKCRTNLPDMRSNGCTWVQERDGTEVSRIYLTGDKGTKFIRQEYPEFGEVLRIFSAEGDGRQDCNIRFPNVTLSMEGYWSCLPTVVYRHESKPGNSRPKIRILVHVPPTGGIVAGYDPLDPTSRALDREGAFVGANNIPALTAGAEQNITFTCYANQTKPQPFFSWKKVSFLGTEGRQQETILAEDVLGTPVQLGSDEPQPCSNPPCLILLDYSAKLTLPISTINGVAGVAAGHQLNPNDILRCVVSYRFNVLRKVNLPQENNDLIVEFEPNLSYKFDFQMLPNITGASEYDELNSSTDSTNKVAVGAGAATACIFLASAISVMCVRVSARTRKYLRNGRPPPLPPRHQVGGFSRSPTTRQNEPVLVDLSGFRTTPVEEMQFIYSDRLDVPVGHLEVNLVENHLYDEIVDGDEQLRILGGPEETAGLSDVNQGIQRLNESSEDVQKPDGSPTIAAAAKKSLSTEIISDVHNELLVIAQNSHNGSIQDKIDECSMRGSQVDLMQ